MAAHLQQRPGEIVRGRQRVRVVLAEPVAPVPVQAAGEIMGGAGIAPLEQVPACVAG